MAFGIDSDIDQYKFDPQLMQALSQGISGSAPSQAEVTRRKAFDEAMRRAMGVVRSNRAQPAAAGTRQALQAQSALQTEGAQQATALRAQEYQQAVAQMLAQQQSQQQGYYQQQQMQQQAQMFNAQQNQALAGSIMNMIGGMGQAAMGAFGSDKRIKEDIKNASDKEIDQFMDALKGYKYKYKKGAPGTPTMPGNSVGEFGVMAQDIVKTSLGKRLVEDVKQYKNDKDGQIKENGSVKMIKVQAIGAALAGLGRLANRVKELESKQVSSGQSTTPKKGPAIDKMTVKQGVEMSVAEKAGRAQSKVARQYTEGDKTKLADAVLGVLGKAGRHAGVSVLYDAIKNRKNKPREFKYKKA